VSEHLGDKLSALLDGALDPAAIEEAHAHLAECPACAAELNAVGTARALVRTLPVVDPPFGWHERMRARRLPLGVGLGAVAAGVAASMALVSMTAPGRSVSPPVAPLVQHHVVSASLVDDPVAQLTAVAVPTTVVRK
jgi:anti-sigma factor RsiW